jgi:hypothetical protein
MSVLLAIGCWPKPDAYLRRPGQSRRAGAARQRLPPSIKLKRKSAEEIGGAPV